MIILNFSATIMLMITTVWWDAFTNSTWTILNLKVWKINIILHIENNSVICSSWCLWGISLEIIIGFFTAVPLLRRLWWRFSSMDTFLNFTWALKTFFLRCKFYFESTFKLSLFFKFFVKKVISSCNLVMLIFVQTLHCKISFESKLI